MKRNTALTVLVSVGLSATASAAIYSYADWKTASGGTAVSGFITLADGRTVDVAYTGKYSFANVSGSTTNYWTHPTTYQSPEVENAPPQPDIIGLTGGNATVHTLRFSTTVVNVAMPICSLGSSGTPATYVFDHPFRVVSNGPGYFGNGTLVNTSGNILEGREGHGTLLFEGAIDSISWTAPTYENWHGFTAAIETVPEPATLSVLAVGLLPLLRRRRR